MDIQKSNRKDKKFMVQTKNGIVNFGQKHYSDYTIHKDKERRKRFYARHYAKKGITEEDIKEIRKKAKQRIDKGIGSALDYSTYILW